MLTVPGTLKFLNKVILQGNIAANSGSFYLESTADGIVANGSGGNASATLLTAQLNRVTNSATNAASVILPAAVAGLSLVVVNATGATANQVAVFPNGTDTIDNAAASASQQIVGGAPGTTGTVVTYYCVTTGKWHTQKGA